MAGGSSLSQCTYALGPISPLTEGEMPTIVGSKLLESLGQQSQSYAGSLDLQAVWIELCPLQIHVFCFGDLSKLTHRLRGLFESLNYSSLHCGHYRRPSNHQQTWGEMKLALDVKSCVLPSFTQMGGVQYR